MNTRDYLVICSVIDHFTYEGEFIKPYMATLLNNQTVLHFSADFYAIYNNQNEPLSSGTIDEEELQECKHAGIRIYDRSC
jgi:hypothetical protein